MNFSVYKICVDDIYIQDDEAELPAVVFGRPRQPEDIRTDLSIVVILIDPWGTQGEGYCSFLVQNFFSL